MGNGIFERIVESIRIFPSFNSKLLTFNYLWLSFWRFGNMAYNVLVVDDSRTTRAFIKKTLNLTGISIGQLYEAENGKEALNIMENEWVDLVLADINMPVMDGVEMVNKMWADGLLKTIPVVIVSTEGSKGRIEEMESKGVRAYIRKPCTPESIKQTLVSILEGQNAKQI
jgi:two-component system chemotaxis response regulator CheY